MQRSNFDFANWSLECTGGDSWHLSLCFFQPCCSFLSSNTFFQINFGKSKHIDLDYLYLKALFSLRGLRWKSLAKLDLNFVRQTNSPPNGFRFCSRIYFKSVYDLSYCIWVAKHIFPFPRFQEIWDTRDIHPTLGFTMNLVLFQGKKEFFFLWTVSQISLAFYRLHLSWLIV